MHHSVQQELEHVREIAGFPWRQLDFETHGVVLPPKSCVAAEQGDIGNLALGEQRVLGVERMLLIFNKIRRNSGQRLGLFQKPKPECRLLSIESFSLAELFGVLLF